MKNLFFLCSCAVISLFLSCGSVERYNEAVTTMHPVEDLHEDIDKAYKQLQRLHPRLYQYTPKETLDYKFDSLKSAINQPMSSRTFHKKLSKVTKYIGQGHMALFSPTVRFDRKQRKALRNMKFDINNLDFEYLDERIIVRAARENDSLLLHAEVLEVNGENALDLLKKYRQTVASDGYNTTFHNRVVGYNFLVYYQQYNGRFDSITLKFRNEDSTFVKTYKRVKKANHKVEQDSIRTDSLSITESSKTLTKAERKAKKKADRLERKERRKNYQKYGYNYKTKKYNRNLSFVGKDSAVALLKIRGFSSGKYKDFYEETFATLDSLGTQNLIIDLRNNFGGRLNEIMTLYGYLTDEPYTLINKSEMNRPFPSFKSSMSNTTPIGLKGFVGLLSPYFFVENLLRTSKKNGQLYYRFKAAKEQDPNPLNFKGNIYVLINGNSFSASSIISSQLKGDKRAIFVGEETGGAYNGTVAGYYKNYELPNTKVRLRIGLMQIETKHKTQPDGYGIRPDVEIDTSYEQRLNHIDAELEWVLNDIDKKSD